MKLPGIEMKNTKVCLECKKELSLDCFHKQDKKYSLHHSVKEELIGKSYGQGRHPRCKECRKIYRKRYDTPQTARKYNLKALYGLSEKQYDDMLIKQDYKCFICKTHQKDCVKEKLYVDHCHNSNKVRKLLCSHCNSALGQAKEDVQILENMIDYINHHKN